MWNEFYAVNHQRLHDAYNEIKLIYVNSYVAQDWATKLWSAPRIWVFYSV